MNKAQIKEFREALKADYEIKLKQLKDELEEGLAFLLRAEKTLTEEEISEKVASLQTAPRRFIRTAVPVAVTAKKRVLSVLETMDGNFSRRDLHDRANNDGKGKEIADGSFAPLFAKLLKSGKVVVVQKSKGRQEGIYRKSGQKELHLESPPNVR